MFDFFIWIMFHLVFICSCFLISISPALVFVSSESLGLKNLTQLGTGDTCWYVYCLQFPPWLHWEMREREGDGWWRCDKCCGAFGFGEMVAKQHSSSTEDWYLLCNSPQRLRLMTLYTCHPSASPLLNHTSPQPGTKSPPMAPHFAPLPRINISQYTPAFTSFR